MKIKNTIIDQRILQKDDIFQLTLLERGDEKTISIQIGKGDKVEYSLEIGVEDGKLIIYPY